MNKTERIRYLEELLFLMRDRMVNLDELLYYKTVDEYNEGLPPDMILTEEEFARLKNYFSSI